MKQVICILLLVCFSTRLNALISIDSSVFAYSEQSKKTFVLPDSAKEKVIFDKKEYQYKAIKKIQQGESFWTKLARIITRLFSSLDRPNESKDSGNILKWIFLFIIIVLAVYLLIKSKFVHFLIRNKRVNQTAFESEEIQYNEERIEDLITKAEQSQNYKMAIRYQLLKMLKYLSASHQIYLESHKTNMDFMYEIKNKAVRATYVKVANAYDLVWYGERNLLASEYESIKEVVQNYSYSVNGEK